jgi:hypothetical protein
MAVLCAVGVCSGQNCYRYCCDSCVHLLDNIKKVLSYIARNGKYKNDKNEFHFCDGNGGDNGTV